MSSDSVADLVRGFVLDGMRSRDQEVCDGEQNQEEEVDIEVVREQLENSTDINEQADILQYLYKTRYGMRLFDNKDVSRSSFSMGSFFSLNIQVFLPTIFQEFSEKFFGKREKVSGIEIKSTSGSLFFPF